MFLNKVIFSLVFFALIVTIKSDTPANCTYEDIRGTWVFHEGSRMNDKTVNCSAKIEIKSAFKFELNFPNIATDEDGNVGVWTIIYNQGFEVTINNRKYFAFSLYSQDGDNVTSYCMHTSWGWAHETGVNPRDWSCYVGAKLNTKSEEKPKYHKINKYKHKKLESLLENRMYKTNFDFIEEINSKQSSWKATSYDFLNDMKMSDLIKLAGGKKSKIFEKPTPSPVDELTFELASEMPESFDWRNVSGENYISPIRNQGNCGSCYAFASMGMNEARLRIKTANKQQNIFSPQDIVECSEYSQGCEGGFPYLIADFMVDVMKL
jgi:cathepsin C